MGHAPCNLQQLQRVTDDREGLEEQPIPPASDLPAGGKEDASSEPAKAMEDETKEDREGLDDQLVPPDGDLPAEDASSEPVKVMNEEIKEEKSGQKDAEALVEELEVKEEATDDKGEVSETKDGELAKSDDGKGTVSSPETSTKRKKDKKKRKGSKGRERSSESSRSVPKLRKKSSRSDGSGGSQR